MYEVDTYQSQTLRSRRRRYKSIVNLTTSTPQTGNVITPDFKANYENCIRSYNTGMFYSIKPMT